MDKIQIYGPGCAKCNTLAKLTQQAVEELKLNASVSKVTDPMLFAVAGVLLTPALVLNGKILISGKVPSLSELKDILTEATGLEDSESSQQDTTLANAEESSCCCKSHKHSGSSETSCCPPAGKSCCCGGGKTGFLRRMVMWIVLILIILAVVKLVNRNARSEEPVQMTVLPVVNDHVEAIYYLYGARCPTCTRMEDWTRRSLEENFPDEIKENKLVFRVIPANAEDVKKYGMTNKSLIISSWNQGKEKTWTKLDRIWDLKNEEEAFKQYVADETRQSLNTQN